MMPSETTPLVLAESSAHVQPHLARRGHIDELRRRADAGDEQARLGLGPALR
jgi:hypothetical protein